MKPTEVEYSQYGKLLRIMVEVSDDDADLQYLCNHAATGGNIAVKIINHMLQDLGLPSHRIADVMGQVSALRQLAMISGGVGLAQTSQIEKMEKQFGETS